MVRVIVVLKIMLVVSILVTIMLAAMLMVESCYPFCFDAFDNQYFCHYQTIELVLQPTLVVPLYKQCCHNPHVK